MTPEAERFNGWAAMLGFVAAVGAYVTTGQIIPGWFQVLTTNLLLKLRTSIGQKQKNQTVVYFFISTTTY